MEASIFYECGHAMEPGAPLNAYCAACRDYCTECAGECEAAELALDPEGRCYECARSAECAAQGDFDDDEPWANVCFCGEGCDK
jgi:hypothetical protein